MVSPILLGRYYLAAKASKKTADEQVIRFYQRQSEDDSFIDHHWAELDATLWHYSRVGTSAALESLFVYRAAKGFGFPLQKEALEIAGLSRNAAKLSSMKDEWLDQIHVGVLANSEKIDVSQTQEYKSPTVIPAPYSYPAE